MRVVINRRYGGFGLSEEAIAWLRERGWKHCDCPEDAPRHDPLLIKCVETLGEKANGEHAKLSIEDAGNAYTIHEHDGKERVEYAGGDAIAITEEEVEQRIAEAVTAERAAFRVKIEQERAEWNAVLGARYAANYEAPSVLSELLAWIEARSKEEASR